MIDSSIRLENVAVSYPILDIKSRSLKANFVRLTTGGKISANAKTVTVDALKHINLDFGYGDRVALIGHNGAGKSTLLKTIAGIYEPTEGNVYFDGELVTKDNITAMRRNMQMVFQDTAASLNPRLTVEGILAEPLRVHRLCPRREIPARAAVLLDQVGLPRDLLGRYPHALSGGQRQRVGIARALIMNPKLIIADEPVSALDVSIQAQVLNLLQQLQKDFNLTYLFISHDLSVVEMISDRIGVMYLGTIVETAPKKELYANPRHPYTRALLSAVPIPDPEVKKERITLKGDLPSPSNPPSGCLFHTRCPHCTEKCKTQVPTPVEIAPGHIVKCHYPELTE